MLHIIIVMCLSSLLACVCLLEKFPYVCFPQSTSDFVGMYIERAVLIGYSPKIAITGAFDAVWSLGVAFNMTEGMRLSNETTDNCNASLYTWPGNWYH